MKLGLQIVGSERRDVDESYLLGVQGGTFIDNTHLGSIHQRFFLFIIAMHDIHLVHETATLSILDSNVDFESHAIIDSPPHNHRHTTGTVPQHCQCFDCIRYAAPNKDGDPLIVDHVTVFNLNDPALSPCLT